MGVLQKLSRKTHTPRTFFLVSGVNLTTSNLRCYSYIRILMVAKLAGLLKQPIECLGIVLDFNNYMLLLITYS